MQRVPMAEHKRFGASFKMEDPEQAEAWRILSAYPPRQRMAALSHMVCGYRAQQEQLECIRTTILEALPIQADNCTAHGRAEGIDDDVLGFLSALQQGDDFI